MEVWRQQRSQSDLYGGPPLRCLVPGDPALPPAVASLSRPPLALFWKRRSSLWPLLRRRHAVAVVGSRQASPHGLPVARSIGRELARAGWPIVSGLAEGIDAAVQRGFLESGEAPIGALGTPLGCPCPKHHASLRALMGREGLLISEHSEGAEVKAGLFAARNRLMIAVVRAVVVVECPRGSGALHSARMARSEALPLWAVPAGANRASAADSNALLDEGASALSHPPRLLQSLGPGPLFPGAPSHMHCPASAEPVGVEASPAARILAALGHGADLQTLGERLKMPPALLHRQLLDLELAGRIVAHPGLRWCPA